VTQSRIIYQCNSRCPHIFILISVRFHPRQITFYSWGPVQSILGERIRTRPRLRLSSLADLFLSTLHCQRKLSTTASNMQYHFLISCLLVGLVSSQGRVPMLRFECSQLVVERLDPLVNPGSAPSPHLHQIVGGNSFRPSMDPITHDLPSISTCTSCSFSEDFSNYWTAVLYFRARNGTFKRVPQIVSEGLTGIGGITVYYIPTPSNQTLVTAFSPGFRMLVGDAAGRSPGLARKVCHRCMPVSGDNNNLNCASPDGETLPKGMCPGGMRSIITFPTCWDGVNLDSPDHKSHVAYTTLGSGDIDVGPTGSCPASHPVVIPQVMYEVMWDVSIAGSSSWFIPLEQISN
jgi:hypothetical protein